jgi:hypothetical protein
MGKVFIKDVICYPHTWEITKVMQGFGGRIRVDARRRSYEADGVNFFSEWCSRKYADRLRMEYFGTKLNITNY